ncbi:MAG TPA: hypothetical protein VMR95_01870 [Candidatus Binatia bacterium]|nr:hypothetical protein [Candidatus Binatia bacterium]
MSELVFHPVTKRQFEQYCLTPTHALLILGPLGVGKFTIASSLAARLLNLSPDKVLTNGSLLLIEPEGQTIGIDQVRQLARFMHHKTIGTRDIRRVVIVGNADRMTIEAQNAFLKSLEEPPRDTAIILTASQQHFLLPTINSRMQVMTVHTPARTALALIFGDTPAFNRAYALSGGLPGLTKALLSDNEAHPLYEAVVIAKDLLRQSTFERLAALDNLTKDKQQLPLILDALERIAQIGLEQSAQKRQTSVLKRWQQVVEILLTTRVAISKNANLKLACTNLCLQI